MYNNFCIKKSITNSVTVFFTSGTTVVNLKKNFTHVIKKSHEFVARANKFLLLLM
jgi:hypothetical protein